MKAGFEFVMENYYIKHYIKPYIRHSCESTSPVSVSVYLPGVCEKHAHLPNPNNGLSDRRFSKK